MILTCPSCSTRYFADDASIGSNGRSVRCAACAHTWFVEPQLELRDTFDTVGEREITAPLTRASVERLRRASQSQSSATAPLSSAARFRVQQADRLRKERVRAAVLAWGATGLTLVATTGSALAFREDVARIWPKTASAYAAVGLDVNIFGLEIADLDVEFVYDETQPILVVRGAVTNIGRDDKQAPVVRLGLRDRAGQEIQHVFAQLPNDLIAAGGALPFEVRIENPDLGAADLEATFSSMGEAARALQARAEQADTPISAYGDGSAPLDLTPAHLLDGAGATTLGSAEPFGDGPDGLAPRQSWTTDGGNG